MKTVTVKYNIKILNRGFLDIATYKYEQMVFAIFCNRKSIWRNIKINAQIRNLLPIYLFRKTENLFITNHKFYFIWKCFVKELRWIRRKKSQEISCSYCSKVIVTRGGVCASQTQTNIHWTPCARYRSAYARHGAARNTHFHNQSLCYTQGCDLWAPHIYNLRDTGLGDVCYC